MNKTYIDVRKKLKSYRTIQKEIESRTKYLKAFKDTLISPLPKTEETLHRIYATIIKDMEIKIKALQSHLQYIEKTLEKLEGQERSVIYYRYILGISWLDMPEYMMYEQRTCQLFEARALKKLSKMNINEVK